MHDVLLELVGLGLPPKRSTHLNYKLNLWTHIVTLYTNLRLGFVFGTVGSAQSPFIKRTLSTWAVSAIKKGLPKSAAHIVFHEYYCLASAR